ncbi:hypothetical protein [Candidatus Halobonum tyrrellensis]|nr:hypothetical protein [Candidatus Halobonum tyrrellensis]
MVDDDRETSTPSLDLGSHLAPGLVAVALFVVMAAVFVGASFGTAAGFEAYHVADNVTVTSDTSANVSMAVEGGATVAVVNGTDGSETVSVSDDPNANVSLVEQNGELIAQVVEPTSVTASLGYAMFNLDGHIDAEGFLVAFELIDIVLVAAIAAAVMLGRSEPGTRVSRGLTGEGGLTDGGRETREAGPATDSGRDGTAGDDRREGDD